MPVIGLTADIGGLADHAARGYARMLAKPFELDELRAAVLAETRS